MKIAIRRTAFCRCLAGIILIGLASGVSAQQRSFELDPLNTTVQFTLDATLHTVHGTFKAKSGDIRFDPQSGEASGKIVVDATSADSGNQGRDHKMHKDVLESDRYREITFSPTRIVGTISPGSTIQVQGIFNIHGADHPLTLSVPLETDADELIAKLHFEIPYVDWGMKNPSTLVLRVSKAVSIDIVAKGHFVSASTQK